MSKYAIASTTGTINPSSLALDATFQPVTTLLSNLSVINSYAAIAPGGRDTLVVQVTGTFSATLTLQASVDATNYLSLTAPLQWFNLITNSFQSTITAPGLYQTTVSAIPYIRVTATAWTSGTAVVSMEATDGNAAVALDAPLPPGSNTIGSVSLAGNPLQPDGTLSVDNGASSLMFDAFDGTLANQWTTGGTAVPTQAGGVLTFNAGTTASATSYITSINPIGLNAESYVHIGWVVALDTTTTLTNNTRWWGWGQNAGTPTSAAPITNGAVFMLDATAGTFYAAIYSAGTRTQTVALTKPTDGVNHRYQIQFRTTRAYFLIDSVAVASIANPNPAVTNNLFLIAGSANAGTAPASATTLLASVASVSDQGDNNKTISDGLYPSVRATVKKASTAVAATDFPLAVGLHPSSPLPAGGNTIGNVDPDVRTATGTMGALNATADGSTSTAYFPQVRLALTGSWVGTVTFQISYDGTTWYTKTLNTPSGTVTSTTTANGVFYGDIGGLFFRTQMTAFTSGTATASMSYITVPASVGSTTLAAGTNAIGAVTVGASATLSTFVLVTAASTNSTLVRGSISYLQEMTIANPTATAAYFKLYNKATAPTVGTDVPLVTYRLAATGSAGDTLTLSFGPNGKRFTAGFGFAVTGLAVATDATATVAGIQISGTYS